MRKYILGMKVAILHINCFHQFINSFHNQNGSASFPNGPCWHCCVRYDCYSKVNLTKQAFLYIESLSHKKPVWETGFLCDKYLKWKSLYDQVIS